MPPAAFKVNGSAARVRHSARFHIAMGGRRREGLAFFSDDDLTAQPSAWLRFFFDFNLQGQAEVPQRQTWYTGQMQSPGETAA
jgi:hypothetical protein